jgi:hypothetical protein
MNTHTPPYNFSPFLAQSFIEETHMLHVCHLHSPIDWFLPIWKRHETWGHSERVKYRPKKLNFQLPSSHPLFTFHLEFPSSWQVGSPKSYPIIAPDFDPFGKCCHPFFRLGQRRATLYFKIKPCILGGRASIVWFFFSDWSNQIGIAKKEKLSFTCTSSN